MEKAGGDQPPPLAGVDRWSIDDAKRQRRREAASSAGDDVVGASVDRLETKDDNAGDRDRHGYPGSGTGVASHVHHLGRSLVPRLPRLPLAYFARTKMSRVVASQSQKVPS